MILMLNCSYKMKNSNTGYFFGILENELEEHFGKKCKTINIRTILNGDSKDFIKELKEAEAFVIGAPLYVDGLPAQAVKILELLLENREECPKVPVYVLSNLGFYESSQIRHLFDMVRNWCKRMGTIYGGGLAVGAGPMISTLKKMPLKSGLNKDIGKGFEKLAGAISRGEMMANYYCKTAIPRFVYIKAAHLMFRRTLKEFSARGVGPF